MSEGPSHNPDAGHPHGDTLPEGAPTEGEAAQEKADEWGEKAAVKPDDTHGAGAHDEPNP